MLRVITRRRLHLLEATIESLRSEVRQVRHAGQVILAEQRLAEQARDFYKAEAAEWKGRASRLIDQIGVTSATLAGPAMIEPAAAPHHDPRRVFTALGKSELKKTPETSGPPEAAAQILGVDETAAFAAVASVTG